MLVQAREQARILLNSNKSSAVCGRKWYGVGIEFEVEGVWTWDLAEGFEIFGIPKFPESLDIEIVSLTEHLLLRSCAKEILTRVWRQPLKPMCRLISETCSCNGGTQTGSAPS